MENNERENNSSNEAVQNDKNYEILPENYPNYDLSFKIIVIGNSGKKKYV